MIYPDSIYPKLEIVEKEIAGQKHYGLIRTRRLFGIIPIRRHVKMSVVDYNCAYESDFMGLRWLERRICVQDVVNGLRRDVEWDYARKMRK